MPLAATEEQEHIAVMEWAKNHPILSKYLIHIPNGGSRNKIEAAKLKRMGVRSGVSDLFLPYPTKKYHGLWVEIKRKRGNVKTTIEQNEWIIKMNALGYFACVARGYEQTVDCIISYLKT